MNSGLLRWASAPPELLVDHAQAYAELVAAEWAQARVAWLQQACLAAAALAGLLLALMLGGVGLLLWAVQASPMPATASAPWLLWALPLLPLALAGACVARLNLQPWPAPFAELRLQWRAEQDSWAPAPEPRP